MVTSSGHIKLTDFGLSQTGLMATTMLTAQDINQGAKEVWQESNGPGAASDAGALTSSGSGSSSTDSVGSCPATPTASVPAHHLPTLAADTVAEDRAPTGSGSLAAAAAAATAAGSPSAVGTPGYMAPEAILGLPAGPAVDFWAVGIILYEMLTGVLPFCGDTAEIVFENTVNSKLEFPEVEGDAVSETAKDLIRHLLMKRPFARLGSQPSNRLGSSQGGANGNAGRDDAGAAQVKRHAFFSQWLSSGDAGDEDRMAPVDWDRLLHQKVLFVPELSSDLDTSYFDPRTDQYQVRQHSDLDHTLPPDEEAPRLRSFSQTAKFEADATDSGL